MNKDVGRRKEWILALAPSNLRSRGRWEQLWSYGRRELLLGHNKAPGCSPFIQQPSLHVEYFTHLSQQINWVQTDVRGEGAKLHGRGPVHSFLWRVTKVCGFECVRMCVCVDSFILHWFRAHSYHILFFSSFLEKDKEAFSLTVWLASSRLFSFQLITGFFFPTID